MCLTVQLLSRLCMDLLERERAKNMRQKVCSTGDCPEMANDWSTNNWLGVESS